MRTSPASSRSKTRTFTVELPESVVQKLGQTTQEATRQLVELAFIELFRQGNVSSGWAARQLGIGKDDFIRLLGKQHGVPYIDLSEEELRQQLEAAMPSRNRPTP
jgi:predicted HTH domain antitoxin